MKWVFILLCLIILVACFGQNTIDTYSLNPKLGYYVNANSDGGAAVGGEVYLSRKAVVYSLSYYYLKEYEFVFGNWPEEYLNEISVSLGKFKGDKIFRFQYQAGISALWGVKRGAFDRNGGLISGDYYQRKEYQTVGLSGKLGFKIVPLKFLSIGLDLQGNLNTEEPFLMNMISIEIGRLR